MPLRLGGRELCGPVLIGAKKNDFTANDNTRNLPARHVGILV